MSGRSTRNSQVGRNTAIGYSDADRFLSISRPDHPSFNNLMLGVHSSESTGADLKPAIKTPEKPQTPYMRHRDEVWGGIQSERPDFEPHDIEKVVKKSWKDVPAIEKNERRRMYDSDLAIWREAMKKYDESQSYKTNLHEKKAADDCENLMEHSRIDEDDNDEVENTVKEVSADRYDVHHKLIQEILSSKMVETGTDDATIEQEFLLNYKAENLVDKVTKLQEQIVQLEREHEIKKKKWKVQTDTFNNRMDLLKMKPEDYVKFMNGEFF